MKYAVTKIRDTTKMLDFLLRNKWWPSVSNALEEKKYVGRFLERLMNSTIYNILKQI